MTDTRIQLLKLLVERSYRWDPVNKFLLTSGKLSDYYLECKLTTFFAPALPLLGEVLYEMIKGRAVAVGGLTQGADPLALSIAYHSAVHGDPVHAFSVRKEPKSHGTRRWVEGCVNPGDGVFVLDDVVTTGGSTIRAIQACRESELDIRGVVVLVDREEDDGANNIRTELGGNLPILSVFTRTEMEAYRRGPYHNTI